MYSLIGRLLDGKPLNLIISPLPSLVIEMDIFFIGALLAVGLFVLFSRMRSQKSGALIFLLLGLIFSVTAYLVQAYMSIWFPELFIPGGPYGTWFTFRNDLSATLNYAALLLGVLVPAVFLVPCLRLSALWRSLLLLCTLIVTSTIYYSYIFSVTIIPGSGISLPGWILAISPFLASIAIAAGILGYFLVLREIFDRISTWPVRIIFFITVTASALLFTYPTAGAVYAVIALIAWPPITKSGSGIRPDRLVACMAGLGAACEIFGSFFAAMGPDVGRFVPVWIFPLLFLALITLVPAPYLLPRINPASQRITVFCVTWGTGILIALTSVIGPLGIFMQPDRLPQTLVSIIVNVVLGAGFAMILYAVLQKIIKTGHD